MMRKWFGLLFVILLIGCERDGERLTPTAVSAGFTPSATRMVTVVGETAEGPTRTPSLTAVPTETVTPRPTTTGIPTPTPPEGFVTPTLPPVTEVAGDSAELYRLRPWSDVEAAELVSLVADYADGIRADYELYSWYGDRGRTVIIEAGREFTIRYPDSPYRTEVECQMVDASTYYPSQELNDLLAKLIEDDLNAGIASLEMLDTYLQPHGLQVSLENRDCQNCKPFPTSIPNLLGDGREIHLFLIERQTRSIDGGVLMAIGQDVDGKFKVTPIISQWAAFTRFSGGISYFEARHITGDSQPELLVELWGHSGSIIHSSLRMYRWDGNEFVELAGTSFNLRGGFLGDQWEFVEGDDPSRLQVIRGFDNTTTIYEWRGDSYERVEVTQENIPPDPTDQPFAPEWIHREIDRGNYTEVVAYLEEAVQRPAESYIPFGTQYHRAMRFVLGMNYVYLEDEEMARSVFEALRDEISPPEFVGFSQAAGAFLEHYIGLESAYEACGAAYDVMLAAEIELSGITPLMPLCDFEKLFVEKLIQYDGTGSVFEYVDAAELVFSQQLDLDGDGQLDWLLSLSHPTLFTQAGVEVWAVLLTDTGTEVVKMTTLWSSEEEIENISVETHTFIPFDTPLIAIHSNNGFRLLQLITNAGEWEAKLHRSIAVPADYTLQMVENNLQLNLFFDTDTSYTVNHITYRWDAEMEKFVEVSRHASNSLGCRLTRRWIRPRG